MCSVKSLRYVSALFGAALIAFALPSQSFAGISYEPVTTDEGARFLLIRGEFAADDPVNSFLAAVGTHNPSFVTFESPGGNVGSAIRLGRMIRAAGLATMQLRQLECSSACALAFLGGTQRLADSGAIGVHRSSFADVRTMDAEKAVAEIQAGTAAVISYILEMGADPALLEVALQYDSRDMRYLSTSEMLRYRVITDQSEQTAAAPAPTAAPNPAAPIPRSTEASTFEVPEPRSGRIRHPKGSVFLKAAATDKAANLLAMQNGLAVQIVGRDGRWYRVNAGTSAGFLHDTWVLVDQFESGHFDARHIQVKSFDNYADAEAYVRSSQLRLAAYLATNGWFAITLDETYSADMGKDLLQYLKSQKAVPDDAYMSYGNTYARKVCCAR